MIEKRLSVKFYNQTAIEEVAKAFRSFGKIYFKKRGGYFLVFFKDVKNDLGQKIANEFGNYVLAQVIKSRHD